ncbi:hypothetical protein F4861DRAFT_443628 [Xylaria intraflava]|nr:hypothetical protein F4861DRAFT_443628 [Xylaria intraflava]
MASTGAGGSLSVIALISGGKDSFFSILHCQANGHRVVALANLYPSAATGDKSSRSLQRDDRNEVPGPREHGSCSPVQAGDIQADDSSGETDLNSFMYQTVGHQIIPLYAQVTGLPLHRQPILGTAVHQGLSYARPRYAPQVPAVTSSGPTPRPSDVYASPTAHERELAEDETESLVPLLRTILRAHPEANALCTGAILSTYQRTRIESVALRLGLVPLSYLWQFTELPASVSGGCYDQVANLAEKVASIDYDVKRRARKRRQGSARDDARLLRDMAAVGFDARIVKVASAGLDEDFLWENVASDAGVQRVGRAMRRFGAAGGRGSILGEGGEFETLVIDGPPSLFKGRIVISDEDRRVVREGGGSSWLRFPRADVVRKNELELAGESLARAVAVRAPELLDPRFEDVIQQLLMPGVGEKQRLSGSTSPSLRDESSGLTTNLSSTSISSSLMLTESKCQLSPSSESSVEEWCYLGGNGAGSLSVVEQTASIVDQIRRQLSKHALPPTAITNSVIVLRHMSDFPLVNERYGSLFDEPNPPSRVTISCGDKLLPEDAMIAVYLTVQMRLHPHERRGLHVQSRSYWAPANIGPYSQAIAFPLLPLPTTKPASDDCVEDDPNKYSDTAVGSPLAVSIAGQIPLVPASMTLPLSSTLDHMKLQITLALQHLWRVGVEMQVRWWTSAVAYFPVTSSAETMQHHALLAATAWRSAHLWPDLDYGDEASNDNDDYETSDNDELGPDLWDRRYNAQFMMYGGGDEEESFPLSLPNWSALKGFDVDNDNAASLSKNKRAHIPFFFAAEVDELPRQAGVEWHAHSGLAELLLGSVTVLPAICSKLSVREAGLLDLDLHHVAVESESAVFVQTIAVVRSLGKAPASAEVLHGVANATTDSLGDLLGLSRPSRIKPKITYAEGLQLPDDGGIEGIGAVIPCRSIWDSQGRRLCAVSVFETRAMKVS